MPMDLSAIGENKSRNRTYYQKNKYSNNSNNRNNNYNNGNNKGNNKKGNCFKCGKPGHYAKECRSQKQSLQILEDNSKYDTADDKSPGLSTQEHRENQNQEISNTSEYTQEKIKFFKAMGLIEDSQNVNPGPTVRNLYNRHLVYLLI
ncbi:hypothetical protein Glove_526g1 [Diversispora epigaea]|uniref:CCHC-type domain-containing protein n=1 Tax=Diversispora epigaea TaxID=1348612 RepID=A0A397GE79_9GLOM|nr:hypothetical protein Glove_526g1 [Diversispora epigaea]